MAKQNIWKILESVAQSQAVSAQLKEEHDREMRELRRIVKETSRQIERVDKQLGELGNKWGSFTEGMAWPSLNRIMRRQFGADTVSPRPNRHRNGRTFEPDVLAYDSRSEGPVYIIEIKSKLSENSVPQLLDTLAEFPEFYPELSHRQLFGVIAAVDMPPNLRKDALKAGFYLAQIDDEVFSLPVPAGFKPTDYSQTAHRNGRAAGRKKKTPTK
ncbi:MAG: DUF3782 domain-containing protein [Blastocatellia bacterium]